MKYSLRSLMIVVTLICIVLGRLAYLNALSTAHAREAQRLAAQLQASDLFFQHEDNVSVDRISREINAMSDGDGPVYVTRLYGVSFLVKRGGYGCECYDPETVDLCLTAIHHQRSAVAYKQSLWLPWKLSVEPDRLGIVNIERP
ncbi:MAG: hypothetical protein K8R36_05910 [Planctomycetales bacterium]|nr:hypothetical protein [Planctomycetales bacterium]